MNLKEALDNNEYVGIDQQQDDPLESTLKVMKKKLQKEFGGRVAEIAMKSLRKRLQLERASSALKVNKKKKGRK